MKRLFHILKGGEGWIAKYPEAVSNLLLIAESALSICVILLKKLTKNFCFTADPMFVLAAFIIIGSIIGSYEDSKFSGEFSNTSDLDLTEEEDIFYNYEYDNVTDIDIEKRLEDSLKDLKTAEEALKEENKELLIITSDVDKIEDLYNKVS